MVGKIVTVILIAGALFVGLFLVVREVNAPDEHPWIDVAPSGESPPRTAANIPEVTADISPEISAFFVQVLGNGLMTALFFSALGLSAFHRRRARAERAFDPKAPLRDGAAVIFGEVECPPGHEGPVVLLEIQQQGTQQTRKGNTSHQWREVDREVRVSPFIVRCDDGTRVQVEPDDHVVIEDDLVVLVQDGRTSRARRAVISAGDRVHITGELRGASKPGAREDGYRGGGRGPVLSPPRRDRMVISKEPPGETAEGRARFHGKWAIAFAICFAVLAGAVLPTYELLAFDGKVVMAEVTGQRTWQEWVKPKNQPSRLVRHDSVRARIPARDGAFTTVDDDCNAAIYACVERRECTHLPFVVASHAPSVHQLGTRPTLGTGRFILLFVLAVLLGSFYPLMTIASRPWYLEKKLHESGSGPLVASKA